MLRPAHVGLASDVAEQTARQLEHDCFSSICSANGLGARFKLGRLQIVQFSQFRERPVQFARRTGSAGNCSVEEPEDQTEVLDWRNSISVAYRQEVAEKSGESSRDTKCWRVVPCNCNRKAEEHLLRVGTPRRFLPNVTIVAKALTLKFRLGDSLIS